MKLSAPLLLAFAGAVSQTQASPVSLAGDGVMTSVGPITPGGPDVTLSGTAESTYKQILVLNPNYNPVDFGGKDPYSESPPTRAKKAHDTLSELEGRTATGGCCWCLGASYNGAAEDDIVYDGVKFLWGLGNRQCTTGSSGVSRLSCSWNAGIWMISTSQRATYSTCTHLGDMANWVITNCHSSAGSRNVNGQLCDSDGFCLAVGYSRC